MFLAVVAVFFTCTMTGICILMLGGIPDLVRLRSTKSANSRQQRTPGAQPAPLNLGWIYKFQYIGSDCNSSKPITVEDAQVTNFCFMFYPLSYVVYCMEQENGGEHYLYCILHSLVANPWLRRTADVQTMVSQPEL